MKQSILLVTLKGYKTAEETFYFSSAPFISSTIDTPANQYYDPVVKNPGSFSYDMFSSGRTGGPSSTGYGETVLVNKDGRLDWLLDYGLDGRQISITEVVFFDDSYVIGTAFVGTMEQPVFTWDEISIRIRDRQLELNVPFQSTKYAGSNVLPNGLEGVEDIKGLPKPRLYGSCFNVTPVLVNTSLLIYQLSDIALSAISNVYDMGIGLTAGTNYTTEADMLANAPAAGEYRRYLSGGYFRLGSSPVGLITADAAQGATAARYPGTLIKLVAQTKIAAADCIAADFTDLDTAVPYALGIYIKDETTVSEILDQLASSVGAFYGFTNTGKFTVKILEALPGSTAINLDASNILTIEKTATNDIGRGVPISQVTLKYSKNYTVQIDGLAGAVVDTRKQYLKNEFSTVTATDATIKTKHLLAQTMEVKTLHTGATAAQAEADRLLALFKTDLSRLEITVKKSSLLMVVGYWDPAGMTAPYVSLKKHASVIYGGYLYAFGGNGYLYTLRLDLSDPTGLWTNSTVTDLPAARYSHTANLYSSFVYIIGGIISGTESNSVIRLDLDNPTGAWDDAGVTNLPQARAKHSCVINGNFLYVIGGHYLSFTKATVWRLDLDNPTGAWDDAGVSDLPVNREQAAACSFDNYIHLFGGNNGGSKASLVYSLDLNNPTAEWSSTYIPPLPIPLDQHRAVLVGSLVYIIGGETTSHVANLSTFRFDLSDPSSSWETMKGIAALLPAKKIMHTVDYYDGKFYLIDTNTSPTGIVYDPDKIDPDKLNYAWERNNIVSVQLDRFGYDAGKQFRIIGSELDIAADKLKLVVWG